MPPEPFLQRQRVGIAPPLVPLVSPGDLERIDGTWQVIRRTNRLLDGTPEARRLLTPPRR